MANSISIKGLRAGYGSVHVLHGIDLQIADREIVALLGTNGNGKSTLIKCIAGLLKPAEGTLSAVIDDVEHDLVGLAAEKIVNLGIALVPEGRHLFPRLTVEENLFLGASRPMARLAQAENLALCFELFPKLKERRKQLAGSMSGGEQQMLALARALMSAPRILLIDEPSVGLAPIIVKQMIDKIGELKERKGLTVLMAEQNFTQTMRIADRGYVIVHGQIRYEGSSTQLRENDLVRQLYLGM